ncbi:hypothetical protein COCVIDRAFT_100319, partial [Bipolaris victoriae FI3]
PLPLPPPPHPTPTYARAANSATSGGPALCVGPKPDSCLFLRTVGGSPDMDRRRGKNAIQHSRHNSHRKHPFHK